MTTAMNSDTAGLSHVFLSPDELAAALPGVTKSTLAMWRYEGKGPRYRKLGRIVVYALDEVEKWIAEILAYRPDKHPGDRLIASWLAREEARKILGDGVIPVDLASVRSRF